MSAAAVPVGEGALPVGEGALPVGERGLLIAASHPATLAQLILERSATHQLTLREVVPAAATVLIELARADDLPVLRDLLAKLEGDGALFGPAIIAGSDPYAPTAAGSDPHAPTAAGSDPYAPTVTIERLITIEVAFDGADLGHVAAHAGLSVAELVALILDTTFHAEFTGFAPGFAYLSGLPPRLHLPRRTQPRTRVPAGSLAIADRYSAVYPATSPGGWHLLGTTLQKMFDPARAEPALITPGATVRFVSLPVHAPQPPQPPQPSHPPQPPQPP